ncbi:hypothetical protein LAZ67_3004228 [Cordylochernes scorpioides]|uniref:Integrase catalytic domain-containing protein n=1 Tax=Cordylochernes scorpioides TaxID=51811 RepID=A0ABY6K9M8_9ARAC|nr:hypothetical protein LAZ67_3004228 [Cordylochernes scorpioides]
MADQPVSSAELKKLRTPVRARFTKAFNELETEIKKKEVKKADVEKILRRLQTHHEKLSILNMRMEEALLRESASEDIFTAEYESVCEYEDNFSNIMTDYEALAEKDDVSTISGTAAMNYQLPKLEFKKFGGEPREWITFWTTAENSEVREAVESFPSSADNYPKVIEYIKSRFGEDEMLVEIYVRDLLQNVLQNVRAEGKMSVVKLYDRLETQLRALETFGVARDKFAAMLYPLVESALPEDTLRVWERSQYTVSGRGVQDKLTQLMTFLKTEVKGESRVNMAKAAFKIDNNQYTKDDRSNRKSLSKKNTGSKMPTATDLANTTQMRNNCIFCGNGHPSQECYSGQRMHLPEKKDKAKGKNVCFWCLLPGHGFKKCRIKPRCPVCGGKHYPIMCPTLEAQNTSHLQKAELKVSGESPATEQETANQFTSTTLNNATVGGVYLQTLIVKISGPKGKHNVRVLLDCGSQRSYISKRMVDALGLNFDVQDLWKLDVLGIMDAAETKSRKDLIEASNTHFKETVKRDESGRYIVSLPWIAGHPPVPVNRRTTENRLLTTTRNVQGKMLYEKYDTIFEEWEKEKFIEEVEDKWEECSYLPHRPVLKDSHTTPIRPVFDASCKKKGLPSLNQCLEKGDNLIELIPDLLLRFRLGKYSIIADIRKAFLQIQVREEDREFLRFLWWKKDQKTLKFYRHCRVVFGLTSSPFLLAATIKYHLSLPQFQDNRCAELLARSFYVDNCILSLSSTHDVKKFIKESSDIMMQAKFELRDWMWNEPGITEQDPASILGMKWHLQTDTIAINVQSLKNIDEEKSITKRSIFSACRRIFDPIQFTYPATIKIKKMVQDAWKENKSWDEPLNEDRRVEFIKWRKQALELDQIKIPRWILPIKGRTTLHVFCDASAIAYATVIFMRIENASVIVVRFVEARNRLATIKRITIPRMELLACLIGARLLVHFVSNRDKEITTLTKSEDWNHVAGEHNPADHPSRGESPSKFTKSGWWEGPKWLQEKKEDWPVSKVQYDLEAIEEDRRKTVVVGFVAKKPEENPWYLNLYEGKREVTLTQILRVIAWMLRFKPSEYKGDIISQEELDSAEKSLVKKIQSESIGEEDPKMKQLHAFQDKEGIWRVKTRIVNRNDDELFRLPILIPTNHPVTKLIVKSVHEKMYHCGAQTLRSVLREKFWNPKARQLVRHVNHKCPRCRRFEAKRVDVPEASLPQHRVRDVVVFEVTGIDLGGPLYLEDGQKVWFVIFTCGVYRAVHLELVTSLSTEALVGAVERLVARRGCPAVIYSDNGTNLVGLRNELYRVNFGVKWKLNPPAAPWWGGWIERIVGLTKKLLRRFLGKRVVNYEEMVTILENCERVINARPLTYIAEDNDDLVPLTPEMFLREPRAEGEIDLNEFRCNFGKSYEKRKRLLKEFQPITKKNKKKKRDSTHVLQAAMCEAVFQERYCKLRGNLLFYHKSKDPQLTPVLWTELGAGRTLGTGALFHPPGWSWGSSGLLLSQNSPVRGHLSLKDTLVLQLGVVLYREVLLYLAILREVLLYLATLRSNIGAAGNYDAFYNEPFLELSLVTLSKAEVKEITRLRLLVVAVQERVTATYAWYRPWYNLVLLNWCYRNLWIHEEKKLMDYIFKLGEAQYNAAVQVPAEWQQRQLHAAERHLHLINVYTEALNALSSRDAGQPDLKPSSHKADPSLECAPVNLHLQRMVPHNLYTDKVGAYDVMTVGAFTAYCQGYKRGGLLKMLKPTSPLDRSVSPHNCHKTCDSVGSQLRQAAEAINLIEHFQTDLEQTCEELTAAARSRCGPSLQTLVAQLHNKGQRLVASCQARLPEDVAALWDSISLQAADDSQLPSNKNSGKLTSSRSLDGKGERLMGWRTIDDLEPLLTSLVAGIMARLWTRQDGQAQWVATLRATGGLLAQFEGLLSCHRDEAAMMEDMVVAIADISRVNFRLEPLAGGVRPARPQPRTEGNRARLLVVVPCPDTLGPSFNFNVTPVFFNIGINELATIAHK